MSHLQPAMRSAEKRVSSASMSALTAAMMILFECDVKRIVLESQTSMVAVCSVINCMQTLTCWAEQSSFLAEVCALFTVARKAYCKANAETGSFAVPEMPLVSEFWVAPVKPPAPVVNLLAKWSIEKQAMFFQRFAIATLFVQKLLESMPDGADELSDQLEKLAAHMADCMCFLHPRPVDMKQQSEDLTNHLVANAKPEKWAAAALSRCSGWHCLLLYVHQSNVSMYI